MNYAINTLREAIKLLSNTPSAMDAPYADFGTYLSEFKTIALRLPRQSGKSKAAGTLHSEISSLLYSNYLGKRFNYDTEIHKIRGIRSNGLKYRAIILDEYETNPEGLMIFIRQLAISGFLEKDFYLIRLYT
jgi:hypothetical protein